MEKNRQRTESDTGVNKSQNQVVKTDLRFRVEECEDYSTVDIYVVVNAYDKSQSAFFIPVTEVLKKVSTERPQQASTSGTLKFSFQT